MKELKVWERAKAKLMSEAPYFGHIASYIELVPCDDLPTFQANAKKLFYNSSWVDELDESEMISVLANGAMHRVLWHENRGKKRHSKLWNLASDYAINALLVENGFELPLLARYEPRFKRMYAEEIYHELLKEQSFEDSLDDDGESNSSDKEDNLKDNQDSLSSQNLKFSNSEESLDEALEKASLEQLFLNMKDRAKIPKSLERLVPSYFAKGIDWRARLRDYIDNFFKSSYSFSPPNLKHLYRGIALPRLYSETLRISVAIDSSGSIDEKSLGEFFAELESILLHFPDYKIDLMVSDFKIRHYQELTRGESFDVKIIGGGHTDFCPVFDFIEQSLERPRLLIYFTDGNGLFPQKEPNYEVLWVLTRDKEIPFGQKIILED